MKWLDGIRKSAVYEPWRKLREQQQLGRAAAFLASFPERAGESWESKLEARMALRRPERRVLGTTPRVLAFGSRDWEEHGLWSSLSRNSEFSLFDYRARIGRNAKPTRKLRRELGRQFLIDLEAAERSTPVQMVFIYAAGFYLEPELLKHLADRGIWTVLLALDDKAQLNADQVAGVNGWQLEAALGVDLYWTSWKAGADWLSGQGVGAWSAPPGSDAETFKPVSCERNIDVLWIGRAYGARPKLLRTLARHGIHVDAYGPGWPSGRISTEEMNQLYSRSKIVLGMGGVGQTDEIKHLKGRDFEVPMSGALYLTSFNPELTEHFCIGKEILCYSSTYECAEVVRWVLARPDKAREVRAAARLRSVADHTWDNRFRALTAIMRGE